MNRVTPLAPRLRHVVVDGSNIATEGHTKPSLQQLRDAVDAFKRENPRCRVTVIVDATFEHRIPRRERKVFEKAEAAGEVTSAPSGVVGRGDAFLLRVADKANAAVLSNDSFQEFQGTYGWLFESHRLIGGKPVPGVGWVFAQRSPVRGQKPQHSVSHTEAVASEVAARRAQMAAQVVRPNIGDTQPVEPTKAVKKQVIRKQRPKQKPVRRTRATAKRPTAKRASAVTRKSVTKKSSTPRKALKKAANKKVANKKTATKKTASKKSSARIAGAKRAGGRRSETPRSSRSRSAGSKTSGKLGRSTSRRTRTKRTKR